MRRLVKCKEAKGSSGILWDDLLHCIVFLVGEMERENYVTLKLLTGTVKICSTWQTSSQLKAVSPSIAKNAAKGVCTWTVTIFIPKLLEGLSTICHMKSHGRCRHHFQEYEDEMPSNMFRFQEIAAASTTGHSMRGTTMNNDEPPYTREIFFSED